MTGPAGIGNTRLTARASTMRRQPTTSRRSVAAIGSRGGQPDRIQRGDDRRGTTAARVQGERARLEHEEVQPLGDAGHLAQDAIEHEREQPAERQRQQAADADEQRRFPQQHRRDAPRPMPSARSAAISPSRWLTDTVSSVATSRNANTSVIVDSTSEICRKYAKPFRLNCATTSSFE